MTCICQMNSRETIFPNGGETPKKATRKFYQKNYSSSANIHNLNRNSPTLLLGIITDGKVPQILTAGLCTQKTYFLGRLQPLETGFLSF